MVSRRNFITITIMMLVLFFLFQFSGIIRETMNDYETNEYEKITFTGLTEKDGYLPKENPDDLQDLWQRNRSVSLIGNKEDGLSGSMVWEWCLYTGRSLQEYGSLSEWGGEESGFLMIDSSYLSFTQEEMELLIEYTEKEKDIVFLNLPESELIQENEKLRSLLGISQVRGSEVSLTGVRLFSGFLLGGEETYRATTEKEEKRQDLELQVPWYVTGSGTKAYMVGLFPDEMMTEDDDEAASGKVKREDLPTLIWRNSVGGSRVYAVCGSYMQDSTAIGILSAMASESQEYSLEAVINAQSMVFVNYPGIASENEAEMMRLYSRAQKDVFRDIVWPGLVSISERLSFRLTCMMVPQLDYEDGIEPNQQELIYYMKLLREEHMETGISADRVGDISFEEKWEKDTAFLEENLKDYTFLSLYVEKIEEPENEKLIEEIRGEKMLSQIRTVFTADNGKKPLVSYLNEEITLQSAVVDGFTHTYTDNLRVRSIETALGYTSILVDLKRAAFPESEEDSWEKLYEKLSSNAYTYWKPYKTFANTTLAESDKRIREFFALDFSHVREGDIIKIHADFAGEEAWLMLRTHGEKIEDITGGTYSQIEKDAYLIQIQEEDVEIILKESQVPYYYE